MTADKFTATNKRYITGIDGLRALAVIAVILFHLNPSFLPGGFTGVDIFFVISGYVVARSLSTRVNSTFSDFIKNFYKRRLIRIYPALLACLIVTSLIVIFFIPRFYVSASIDETGLAAFFGLSNILLALDTESYFSQSTDLNPFVHTWSLGVEEQFYFIFPVFFYFWLKGKFKYSIPIMFIVSIWLSFNYLDGELNKAYYFITSRFWELAAGVMLYQYHHSHSRSLVMAGMKRETILISGLVITLLGLIFSNKNQFPLPWAILPVLGTTLLLHGLVCSSKSKSIVDQGFSVPLMTHFGKLSYSLYLWHWPIFTFFRWTVGLQTYVEYAFALILTYFFAVSSYYLLEIRFPKAPMISSLPTKTVLLSSIPSISVLALLIFLGFKGQPMLSFSATANKEVWTPYTAGIYEPKSNLILSDRTLYVIGDSHVGAYQKMLEKLSQETGINIKTYSEGGCGVTNMLRPVLIEGNPCLQKVTGWIAEIKQSADSEDIVFFATLKMRRSVFQSSMEPGDLTETLVVSREPESVQAMQEAYDESLRVILDLSNKTKFIMIDAPKPIFNYIAFRCADWYTVSNPICLAGYTETREFMELLGAPTLKGVNTLKEELDFLTIWEPLPILCTVDICSLYRDGKPLYFDSDHLSGFGNEVVYKDFKSKLFETLNIESQIM
jgi:peptidoglycan/LPS O-acetylase OafA/YrhL